MRARSVAASALLDLATFFLHRASRDCPRPQRPLLEELHQSDAVLAGKKVLIVDDDMRNIFALSTVLEEHAWTSSRPTTAATRSSMLQNEPDIDIVLMDIMMPEMDGIDTMREIRKMPACREPADRRGDRQGHEGRPREVHRGRRLGLPVQAGGTAALLAVLRAWLHH